jgi:pimeloyl-ACP methyl ester carboxylesterase
MAAPTLYEFWMNRGAKAFGIIALAITTFVAASAEPLKLETESYLIPATDAGIQLYIRNKHPVGINSFQADKILLFVHGATYPAETFFDMPLSGLSLMDYIAQQGWDVYLVDVRGYGGSTRPPEMNEPPLEHKPIAHTTDAVRDVGAAVDHILRKRGVSKINLMGWSWGTAIMGLYTSEHNAKVDRLVLYAPAWISTSPAPAAGDGSLPCYRTVTVSAAKERWLRGVPEDKKADLIPTGWFEQWADATWATDPTGSAQNPPVIRAPNGVAEDFRDFWRAGIAQYDPGKITVPTLLIHAEWDQDLPSDLAQRYFTKLTNAPYKRFVELGEGTHMVILEKNRMQFFREVMAFLSETDPLALN